MPTLRPLLDQMSVTLGFKKKIGLLSYLAVAPTYE